MSIRIRSAIVALALALPPAHAAQRVEPLPLVVARPVMHVSDVAAKRQVAALPPDLVTHDAAASVDGDLVVIGTTMDAMPRLVLRAYQAGLTLRREMVLGPAEDEFAAPANARLASDGQGRAWATDPAGDRLWIVDGDREPRSVRLEARPVAIAWNRAANTVVVGLRTGQLALFSPAGERLDTVPAFRAQAAAGTSMRLAVDPSTGDLYGALAGEDMAVRLPLDRGAAALFNMTDLWLSPSEPGWGAFIDQQGTSVFAVLFVHTAKGDPTWYVMSNGARQPDGSFSGVLYRTRGGGGVLALPVGFMRIVPGAEGRTSLNYVVDGFAQTKSVERFSIDGRGTRVCGWDAGDRLGGNFTGLWSNPADPGWGLALAQRGNNAFGIVFTYDEQDRPTWMAMSNGRQSVKGAISGDLYRVAKTRVQSSGTLSLRLSAAAEGAMTYRIDGIEFRSPLLRQVVAAPVSRCEP